MTWVYKSIEETYYQGKVDEDDEDKGNVGGWAEGEKKETKNHIHEPN